MSRLQRLGWGAARTFYRLLLFAYPPDFRRRDGAEAAALFADACRDSRGMRKVASRLVRALCEVPLGGLQERCGGRAKPPGGSEGARGPMGSPGPPHERGTGWLAQSGADARFALRSLRRRPGLALAVVATLALGIGANTAIFSVIEATILASSPWPDPDRFVHVRTRLLDVDAWLPARIDELQRWKRDADVFDRVEARISGVEVLGHTDGARRVSVTRVTAGYLDALGVEPLLGRFFRADDTRPDADPVVVVPEGQWRRLFGADADVLRRSVELDGVLHRVIGVAPAGPAVGDYFIKPLPGAGSGSDEVRVNGIAWLRPGVSFEQASSALAAVSRGEHERFGRHVGEIAVNENVFRSREEYRNPLLGLMIAVFFLLLIACVNVANLLLAAAGARRAELAVRAALGASRARLMRFLMAESLTLSILGGIAGVGLARGVLAIILGLRPEGQLGGALETVRLDLTALVYATLVVVFAAMVFGTLPALRGARHGQRGALQAADPRAGGGRSRLRGALVATETALSLVLLIAAGLTFRSFVELRFADPGFDADRVLSVGISLPPNRYPTPVAQQAFFDDVLAEVAAVPGIESVSFGYGALPPSDLATGGELLIDGHDAALGEVWMMRSVVRESFLRFMGIPLLAGRDLNSADMRHSEPATDVPVVINQSMAQRFWPQGDAVGARFRFSLDPGRRWYIVVGIAADVRQQGPTIGPGPQLYEPLAELDPRYTELLIRTHAGVVPPIRELRAAIGTIDPQIPTDELGTAAARLIDSISESRFRTLLFGAFGALATGLAAVGISGVVAYGVTQRRREMGIRLALGARPNDVRRLVLARSMAPVVAGISLGGLVAVAVTRQMSAFLHGVEPTDPFTFVTMSAVLLGVALLATWVPARRATRVDPRNTLYET